MLQLWHLFSLILVLVVNSSSSSLDFPLARETLKNAADIADISKICQNQIDYLVTDGSASLISMIDASSKIIYPGMLYGSTVDLGMYDECTKIDVEYAKGRLLGKHCTQVSFSLLDNTFSESVCVPDGCSQEDIALLYESSGLERLFPAIFSDILCKTKETTQPIDGWGKAGITIFSLLLACVVISTAYDGYCHRNEIKAVEILNAFSVYTNTKKLFTISKGSREQVQIFAGLKFISMMWIIAGHGMGNYAVLPVSNILATAEWLKKDYIWYITAGPLSVETFFYISGFLLPYTYIKQMINVDMLKQAKNVPMLYIHRYVRLTPAVFGIWLFVLSIYIHLGDGPIWGASETSTALGPCKNHIAAYFTYIQNYNNYDDLCLVQTWYLSADMQMFLISPLVLIPTAYLIHKNYMKVMLSLIGLVIFTIILPIIVKYANKEYTAKNSYDTHSRICTYFAGFLFGTYMRMNLDKPFIIKKHATVINMVIWCITLGGMFGIVYLYNYVSMGRHFNYDQETFFYSLIRPLWALGLSWIVYSSYHGYGGIITSILSNSFMQIGSRLSYSVYLLHPLVMGHYKSVSRIKAYFSPYIAFYDWCGYFIVSLLVAYIWTLLFESPFIIIEKTIFGHRGVKKPLQKKLETSQEAIVKGASQDTIQTIP